MALDLFLLEVANELIIECVHFHGDFEHFYGNRNGTHFYYKTIPDVVITVGTRESVEVDSNYYPDNEIILSWGLLNIMVMGEDGDSGTFDADTSDFGS